MIVSPRRTGAPRQVIRYASYTTSRAPRAAAATISERSRWACASAYSFRLHVMIETSAPAHGHLERSLIVAAAARGAGLVVYDAYRMT